MRILLTRPRDDTAALAEKLRGAGHDVLSEPMLEIRFVPGAGVDLEGAQAVLFTSANGVRAFAAAEARRDLPVFAVGEATAAAARRAGFARVESAAGRVDDLVRLVRDRLVPGTGALVHAAGRDVAGDIAGELGRAGFEVRRAVLYTAESARTLSPDTARALKAGEIDAVLFYSARSAQTFRRLIDEAGLAFSLARTAAFGLSHAAVEPVTSLPWARIDVAAHPDEGEILRLVGEEVPLSVRPEPPNSAPPKSEPARDLSHRLAGLFTPKAEPAGPRQPRFLVPMVWLAVLLSLGTFFLQTTQTTQPLPDPASSLRVTTLERRMDTLARNESRTAPDPQIAARLKELGDRIDALAARPAPAGDPAGLGQHIDDLEKQLADIQKKLAASVTNDQLAALAAENQRLSEQVAELQTQITALGAARRQNAAREGVLLAAGQVALAAASGNPIGPGLATLRALAGDDPHLAAAIGQLDSIASRPVPSFESLAARFSTVATAALQAAQAEAAPPAATGGPLDAWWREMVRRLSAAVTIRKVGEVAGDDPAARVARAEQRLAAHDLAGAVEALASMTGAPSGVLAGWVDDARARLTLDKGLADLSSAAIAASGPP
ncbi:MAG TPA: uroporphyrinogen-III synthase [Alphaproteobacteria bacterium]|nr:uroporphyrinogen-III synthase [Alphaproteobacteria bacterium]